MGKRGIQSDEHRAALMAARDKVRNERVCGARTRTGALCRAVPIREGKGRCLRHAGPKAANAHRQRMWEDVRRGKVSAEVWQRAEARRAANALQRAWRRDPWIPGRTIDLGPHEAGFAAEVAALGVVADSLPPALADWLRWRYRRTRIDRRSDRAWRQAVTADLPRRVAQAGARPVDRDALSVSVAPGEDAGETGQRAALWAVDGTSGGGVPRATKRALPDRPAAPKVVRGKGHARPGRPRTRLAPHEAEAQELARLARENAALVVPIFEACENEAAKLAVMRTLRDYVRNPQCPTAAGRWLRVVLQFRRALA